jgi:predicted nucleic acid-binding protein
VQYVLDTNVFIDLLSQREDITAELDQAIDADATLLLCPFVYYEMERGFRRFHQPEKEQRFLLLSHFTQWENLKLCDWNLSAQPWARNEEAGRRKSDADLAIAAFALNRGATVVTADMRAFDDLPVAVENWRAEY